LSDPLGAPSRHPGEWAENVDPALAALWDSGVIAPLEAAEATLGAAQRREETGALEAAARHVATARDSVLAAADSIDDDEPLRRDLLSLAEGLTDVSADLLGPVDRPAVGSLRERLDETRRGLERVFG
jgi:hypothetical protein